MNYINLICVSAVASFFSGCVALSPTESAESTPDEKFGYIASATKTTSKWGHALYATNTETNEDFVLKLGEPASFFGNKEDVTAKVTAIKVPPGTYAITQWASYASLTGEISTKKQLDQQSGLEKSFTVDPGMVVFLGQFSTSSDFYASYPYFSHTHRITSKPISFDLARSEFITAYPKFDKLKFTCISCYPDFHYQPTPKGKVPSMFLNAYPMSTP